MGLHAFNIIAIVLIVFPIFQTVLYETRAFAAQARSIDLDTRLEALGGLSGIKIPGGDPPDIYYIILDAYTREDTLQNIVGYDNGPFIDSLEKMGFSWDTATRAIIPGHNFRCHLL
jgi:hypothetical protein